MDARVRSLISQLSATQGRKVVSYGKELNINEEQVKQLVALNFVFEGRIAEALGLIEQGLVAAYAFKGKEIYCVDNELVFSYQETCTCLGSWCKHLLAMELTKANLFGITTCKQLEPEEFVSLVYDGKAAALV